MCLVNPVKLDSVLTELVAASRPLTIGFVNHHAYNLCYGNGGVFESFLQCDYLFRDGSGMNMACNLNNIDPGMDMNGTDLIPLLMNRVFDSVRNCQYFVYGTRPPWLKAGADAIFEGREYQALDGFQGLSHYCQHFNAHQNEQRLAIVILAMGMPKQEALASALKKECRGAALIICGGAIIDFQAGRFKRAPMLIRDAGFEWVYRFCREPVRLFKRYFVGIPLFFYNLLRNYLRNL